MASTTQTITDLENQVSNLSSRLLSVTPNQIVPVVVGKYVVFGCLVTEGVDATDNIVTLEGQATGDEVNLNPDLSATPSRGFEFPNIGSTLGGMFTSNDIDSLVAVAPATGTARYDIAYIFAGKEGSGFAIQTGTPSVAIKDDFDTYGLDTSPFGEAHDPAIPSGSLPIARIYVEDDVTGIPDARIADIRDLSSSLFDQTLTSVESSVTLNSLFRASDVNGQELKKTEIIVDDSDNMSGVGTFASGTHTIATGDFVLTAGQAQMGNIATVTRKMQFADNEFLGFGNGTATRPDYQLGSINGSTLELRCGSGDDLSSVEWDSGGNQTNKANFNVNGGISTFSRADATPAGTASTNRDDGVFGSTDTTNTGITLFGSGEVAIGFGDAALSAVGLIRYIHSTNALLISTNNALRWTINSDGDLLPGVTETQDIGSASLEIDNIFLQNAATVSDKRRKNDLGAIDDALTFIELLDARLFTRKNHVIREAVAETIEKRQKTFEKVEDVIEVIDGIPTVVSKSVKKLLFNDVDVVKNGEKVKVKKDGKTVNQTHPVPVMEDVIIPAVPELMSSHSRPHAGWMAQAVKQAMTDAGIDDLAVYAYYEEEDIHVLRPLEMVPYLQRAVQQLLERIKVLEDV